MTKILIFLFVNGKCYGTQMHRLLKTPLTPIQKALNRLEHGGIITSFYEGKTRLYQFNPGFPLLNELEQLLRKTYTLLSSQEKKEYYVAKETSFSLAQDNHYHILLVFWEKLKMITQLSFHAQSKSQDEKGWNGKGQGKVLVTKEGDYILIFQEKGIWQSKEGNEVNFSNIFRWSLDRQAKVISLEHLRRGPDQPVFLVHLAPRSKNCLISINSHLCEGDTYFGQIHFDRHTLRLNWRVIGPKKNEEIDYCYS